MAARTLRTLGRRRPPLDWNRLAEGLPPEGPPSGADIVIPVYGAPEEFRRCLASVLTHTDLSRHRLVAVLDGPGQVESKRAIEEARQVHGPAMVVLENASRLGFVRTANRALAQSTRDVVLLNSDTEVTEHWLDKLVRAAYAHPAIATVTPFSNNATLCSLPRQFEANALPAGHDVASFAALVERVAEGQSPRLPTGVGVCLFIKRTVLHRLGFLDEEAFGLGYGEEVDFCLGYGEEVDREALQRTGHRRPLASGTSAPEIPGRSRPRDRGRLRQRPLSDTRTVKWHHAAATLRQVFPRPKPTDYHTIELKSLCSDVWLARSRP